MSSPKDTTGKPTRIKAKSSPGKNSLPRTERITNSSDFTRQQRNGRRIAAKDLSFVMNNNGLDRSRLGLVVSKKVDKRAVVRNRIKRRLREIFRSNKQELPQGFDIIVIARQNAANCSFAELKKQFLRALSGKGGGQK